MNKKAEELYENSCHHELHAKCICSNTNRVMVRESDYLELKQKISRLVACIKKLSVYGDEGKWADRYYDEEEGWVPIRWAGQSSPWLIYCDAIESVKDILDEN